MGVFMYCVLSLYKHNYQETALPHIIINELVVSNLSATQSFVACYH